MTNVARIERQESAQPPRVHWLRRLFYLSYWSESGLEKENLLHAVMEYLVPRKYLVAIDQGWDDHDLMVYRGIWSKADLTVAVENHGAGKRLLRTRCRIRETLLSRVALLWFVGLAAVGWFVGIPEISELAVLLGLVVLGIVVRDNVRLGRIMWHVLEAVARHIQLSPVDHSTR